MSHSAFNSRVSEVSSFVLTSFMMSEAPSTTVENVVFFSMPSIVITGNLIMMLCLLKDTTFQLRSIPFLSSYKT